MGKVKSEPGADDSKADVSIKTETLGYDDKVDHCSVIAKPMAPKKLSKKIYKLIKKSSGHKNFIRNGLKIVQKQLRLGEKGIVVFAGDISPIEIMCHLPAVCEEKDVPYCYTPSRKDIGLPGFKAGLTKLTSLAASAALSFQNGKPFWDLYNAVQNDKNCEAAYPADCSSFHEHEMKVTTEVYHSEL